MGDSPAGSAIRAIELLRAAEIPFMGTLVPLPQQGLDDVERTIEYMDANERAHDPRLDAGAHCASSAVRAGHDRGLGAARRRAGLGSARAAANAGHRQPLRARLRPRSTRSSRASSAPRPPPRPASGGGQGDQRRWEDGSLTRSRRQPAQAGHAQGCRRHRGRARRLKAASAAGGACGRGGCLPLQAPWLAPARLHRAGLRGVPARVVPSAVPEPDPRRRHGEGAATGSGRRLARSFGTWSRSSWLSSPCRKARA